MNKRQKLISLLISVGIVASAFPSSETGATSDSIAFYNSKKSILEMRGYDEAYDTNHDGVVNVFDVIRENKEVFQEESYTDLKAQIHSLETQIEILTQKLTEKEDKTQSESDLSNINFELSSKVDKEEGKNLCSNDYTDEDKNKLNSLENYDDTEIKLEISDINIGLSSMNEAVSGKVDKQEGKQLSSNDYTDSDKEKLKSLENYDDTKINDKIDSLVKTAYEEKNEVEISIQNKVEKEEGKQLSSNDYTDEEKQKLESLYNYDDTDLENEITDIKSDLYNTNDSAGILFNKTETITEVGSSINYDVNINTDETMWVMFDWISHDGESSNVSAILYGYDSSWLGLDSINSLGGMIVAIPRNKNFHKIRLRFDLEAGKTDTETFKITIKKIPKNITVGKNNCDFTDIQTAIDMCNDTLENHRTIYIENGTYSKFSMSDSNLLRYISLYGESKENTIVLGNTGKYEEATAEIRTIGTVKNISFKQIATNETYSEGAHPYCYAMHDDYDDSNVVFENCSFMSNAGPAVGLGLRANLTKEFVNCDFICEADGTYGENVLGAFYAHNNLKSGSLNQGLYLRNCTMVNKYGERGIVLSVVSGYEDGTYDVRINNCGIYGVSDTPYMIMMPLSYSYGNVFNTNFN